MPTILVYCLVWQYLIIALLTMMDGNPYKAWYWICVAQITLAVEWGMR